MEEERLADDARGISSEMLSWKVLMFSSSSIQQSGEGGGVSGVTTGDDVVLDMTE